MTDPGLGERVVVITVKYGNGRHTRDLAGSLARLDGVGSCRLVVVDNGAGDSRALAEGQRVLAGLRGLLGARVTVIPAPKNLFYWRGAVHGLQLAYSTVSHYPDWIIVANDDIIFPDSSFVSRLLTYDGARFHVIAPSIISTETGRDQNPIMRTPMGRLERAKWLLYFSHYYVARGLLAVHAARRRVEAWRRPLKPPTSGQRPERIYAPHGSCVIFSRQFFERGGRLDTGFVMYGEELSVAEVSRRLDLEVYYCPDVRVLHSEHATTGARLTREKFGYERDAYRHILRTYR